MVLPQRTHERIRPGPARKGRVGHRVLGTRPAISGGDSIGDINAVQGDNAVPGGRFSLSPAGRQPRYSLFTQVLRVHPPSAPDHTRGERRLLHTRPLDVSSVLTLPPRYSPWRLTATPARVTDGSGRPETWRAISALFLRGWWFPGDHRVRRADEAVLACCHRPAMPLSVCRVELVLWRVAALR